MPLDDLLSGAELAEMTIGGWRYLLSRSFRLKKHREWREQTWIEVLFEVAFGIAGVVISIGLLGLLFRMCLPS